MADGADPEEEPVLGPATVAPGTSLLVAGPAMTGKRRLMYRILGGAGDGLAAFVTTKLDGGRLETELAEHWALDEWDLRIVDCVSRQRAVTPLVDTETRRYVATAGDLTGIGIALSGFMQDAYHHPDTDHAAVGLHSLSTMLMYADLRRVFQFVHVITGRIDSSDFVGAFCLDTSGGADESVSRLKGLFDGLIEVREGEAGPELRTRGEVDGPVRWTAF